MAELKTKPTDASVEEFLNQVEKEQKRIDAFKILNMFKEITGEEPRMWGASIIGFGDYNYKYPTGREGAWFQGGFSPRKQSMTIYIMSGFRGLDDYLKKLGKHKIGKGCLYFNKLEDVNEDVLKDLIKASVDKVKKNDIYYE